MTTVSIPNGRNATKRTRKHNMGKDLITIYESEDEAKLEEDPTDAGTGTSRRRRTNNRDPGSTPSSKAKRRLMMEDKTQPLGKIRKPSAQPDWKKGNTNTKKILVGQTQEDIREVVYMDDRARPHYEYIELTTTESESSQYLDLDSSDDDGHKECELGGYRYCPDNPANRPTARHQEDNFDENYPDPYGRGIT